MPRKVFASVVAGITDLKKDPMGTVEAGNGKPILILNRNEPAFYCVPAQTFEQMMTKIEAKKSK